MITNNWLVDDRVFILKTEWKLPIDKVTGIMFDEADRIRIEKLIIETMFIIA